MLYRIITVSILFFILAMCSIEISAMDVKDKDSPQSYIDYAISKQKKDPEEAYKALDAAYLLSKKQQNLYLLTKTLFQQSLIAKLHKDYLLAEQYLLKAEARILSLNDSELSVHVLTNMSSIQRYLKKYGESMKYVNKALKIARESREPRLIFKALQTKGSLLGKMKRYEDSITEFLSAQRYLSSVEDKIKVRLFRDTANGYNKLTEYESSIRYYKKAVKILEETNNQKDIPKTLIELAKTQSKLAQYSKAIENTTRALSIAEEFGKEKEVVKALVVLSIVYRKISSYDDALSYALRAMEIHRKNKNYSGLAASANSIALVYVHLNQKDNAKSYFKQVLNISPRKIQPKYRAAALRGYGKLIFPENNQEGLDLSNESHEIYEKLSDRNGVATVQKNLGYIYYKMGDLSSSTESYSTAIKIFKSINDVWNESESKARMAIVLIEVDINKAVLLAKESLYQANDIGAKSVSEQAYSALILAEEKRENYKEALRYAKIKAALIDEIKTDEINKRSTEMYIILDIEKKEREFERLKREKSVISLELDNQEKKISLLEKENEINELQAQNTLIIVSVIIITIVVGLLIISRVYFNVHYRFIVLIVILAITLLYSFNSHSTDIIKISGRDSSLDVRPKYTHLVLEKALELSVDKYGPYEINVSHEHISNDAKRWALIEGTDLNLTMAMSSPDWEYMSIPIRIPIRRGIGSYRLLAINNVNLPKFADLTTLKQLKSLSVGLQSGWILKGIMEDEDFDIVESSNYDGIFKMLNGNRFDFIPRGVHEVYDELFLREKELTNIIIEPNIALYIPQPYYIFVSRKHPQIAERVTYGLEKMISSGVLKKMFDEHYAHFIKKADLSNRTIINFGNKYLTKKTPFERKELWVKFDVEPGSQVK